MEKVTDGFFGKSRDVAKVVLSMYEMMSMLRTPFMNDTSFRLEMIYSAETGRVDCNLFTEEGDDHGEGKAG